MVYEKPQNLPKVKFISKNFSHQRRVNFPQNLGTKKLKILLHLRFPKKLSKHFELKNFRFFYGPYAAERYQKCKPKWEILDGLQGEEQKYMTFKDYQNWDYLAECILDDEDGMYDNIINKFKGKNEKKSFFKSQKFINPTSVKIKISRRRVNKISDKKLVKFM